MKRLYGTYTSIKYNPEDTTRGMMERVRKGIDRLIKKCNAFEFPGERIIPDFDTMEFIIHLQGDDIMTVGIKFYGEEGSKVANNRMRLKCRVCGKTLPLAKSMGSGYYVSPAFSQENLEEFLTEHAYCMNGDGSIIPDEGNYCIAYEDPAEGQETF